MGLNWAEKNGIFSQNEKNEILPQRDKDTRLYIKNDTLRITYHCDDKKISFASNSDFYWNGNELVDTDDIGQFLQLDYREKDLTDTLRTKGYFLIGEKNEEYPDYMKDFFENYWNFLLNWEEKEIQRTNGEWKLVFVHLTIWKTEVWIFQTEYTEIVNKILQDLQTK